MFPNPIEEDARLPEGLSEDERTLLLRHLPFYRRLETGRRTPARDAQRQFVAVLGMAAGVAFHALFGVDVEADHVRVVTAYRPNPTDWEPDLKTRSSKT